MFVIETMEKDQQFLNLHNEPPNTLLLLTKLHRSNTFVEMEFCTFRTEILLKHRDLDDINFFFFLGILCINGRYVCLYKMQMLNKKNFRFYINF